MQFPSNKASTNAFNSICKIKPDKCEDPDSNTEREVLGILHDLEKCHHHCFTYEVIIITDHKQLVAIFKKDIARLSLRFQRILQQTPEYNSKMLYKSGT